MAAPVCKSDLADKYEAMREKSHELTVIIEDGALWQSALARDSHVAREQMAYDPTTTSSYPVLVFMVLRLSRTLG